MARTRVAQNGKRKRGYLKGTRIHRERGIVEREIRGCEREPTRGGEDRHRNTNVSEGFNRARAAPGVCVCVAQKIRDDVAKDAEQI